LCVFRPVSPGSMGPKVLRLATMPPTEMPPKPTPW
jgi:hypothetical protein